MRNGVPGSLHEACQEWCECVSPRWAEAEHVREGMQRAAAGVVRSTFTPACTLS